MPNLPSEPKSSSAPVSVVGPASDRGPAPGIALCLSGGGYRAMVFHVGALWRLNEAGLLDKIDRISSVSGGSITAGVLGMNWSELGFDSSGVAMRFHEQVVAPIRRLAGTTIDVCAIFAGILIPWVSIGDRVAGSYRKYLFGRKTLQDLPDKPRFVINATNAQSGALWRFMKPYMRDYRVGEVRRPTISLATAVAASSAFPPVLSPVQLKLRSDQFTPNSGVDLQREPFTSRVVLADGGVYDNLGLETAWKRFQTVLVSDAGAKMAAEGRPKGDWARQSLRVLDIIDNQVRSLRKRQLIDSYTSGQRQGAYWGISTDITNYPIADVLPCPIDRTMELATVPTRLKRLDSVLQERLINWGYAVTDAALRAHLVPKPAVPIGFPYPGSGV
jgi:NTE family protein